MNGYFLYGIGIIAVIGIPPFCACHLRAQGWGASYFFSPYSPRPDTSFQHFNKQVCSSSSDLF